ncbi:peptidylprolyl isomerase [Rapidithrix thailandica]|uniref:peptidylprolyl isomerase n=1 Tax=Rapidithrix thailandica TaxID=413964 RepID=A0AAW9RWZ7_9BACT
MRHFFYLILILLVSWGMQACDTSKKQVQNTKKQKTEKKKKNAFVTLNQQNAEVFLREYAKEHPETKAIIKTSMGNIKVKLYEDTPLHRANFIRLAKMKFYDNTLFYRIIKGFMIQGGGSDDLSRGPLTRKVGKYKIPAEINTEKYFHKRGALAMSRDYKNNPEKLSASFDFYLVQGTRLNPQELLGLQQENNIRFSTSQTQAYTTLGGAAHLDEEHTVFGEVIEGLEVIDKIAAVKVGEGDWPLENVIIQEVRVLSE